MLSNDGTAEQQCMGLFKWLYVLLMSWWSSLLQGFDLSVITCHGGGGGGHRNNVQDFKACFCRISYNICIYPTTFTTHSLKSYKENKIYHIRNILEFKKRPVSLIEWPRRLYSMYAVNIILVRALKCITFLRVKLHMWVTMGNSMNTWHKNRGDLFDPLCGCLCIWVPERCKSGVKSQKVQAECTDGFLSSSCFRNFFPFAEIENVLWRFLSLRQDLKHFLFGQSLQTSSSRLLNCLSPGSIGLGNGLGVSAEAEGPSRPVKNI